MLYETPTDSLENTNDFYSGHLTLFVNGAAEDDTVEFHLGLGAEYMLSKHSEIRRAGPIRSSHTTMLLWNVIPQIRFKAGDSGLVFAAYAKASPKGRGTKVDYTTYPDGSREKNKVSHISASRTAFGIELVGSSGITAGVEWGRFNGHYTNQYNALSIGYEF